MSRNTLALLLLAVPILVAWSAPALAGDGPTAHVVAQVSGMS